MNFQIILENKGKLQSDDTASVLFDFSEEQVSGKLPLSSFSIKVLYYIVSLKTSSEERFQTVVIIIVGSVIVFAHT